MPVAYDFDAPLWQWHGPAAWYFISVPLEISDEIAARMDGLTAGFGSVKVIVRIGGTTWSTSLFPDSGSGCYLLPIKKAVREAEGLTADARARIHLEIVNARP